MTTKANACQAVIILSAIACSALAFRHAAPGPVYLYTHNPVTGKCDLKDSTFAYTPVDPGTPGASAILGNLGNPDGKGECDTVYVVDSYSKR